MGGVVSLPSLDGLACQILHISLYSRSKESDLEKSDETRLESHDVGREGDSHREPLRATTWKLSQGTEAPKANALDFTGAPGTCAEGGA